MKRPHRVLVALDESGSAWRALRFALRRAAKVNSQVTVLSVLDSRAAALAIPAGAYYSISVGALTQRLEDLFQKARVMAAFDGVEIETQMTASSTDAADGIVRAAREGLYDEIVLGHRVVRGPQNSVLGSTALGVLASSEVPVTIVP